MLPLVTDEVFVLRAPKVTDAYGSRSRRTKDWDNAVRTGPFPACVQPDSATLGASLATKEDRKRGREQTERAVQVFLNPGVDVLAGDALEIDGALWQVDGDPFTLPDLGGLGHMICKADLVRG